MEEISSQQFIGICNRVHVITSQRDNNILRKISKKTDPSSVKYDTFEEIGNKLIIHPTKSQTPDHNCDVVKISLWDECYDSIF